MSNTTTMSQKLGTPNGFMLHVVVVHNKTKPRNKNLPTECLKPVLVTRKEERTPLDTVLRRVLAGSMDHNQARFYRLDHNGWAGDWYYSHNGFFSPIMKSTRCSECRPTKDGDVAVVFVNATFDDLDPDDPKLVQVMARVVKNAKQHKRNVAKPKKPKSDKAGPKYSKPESKSKHRTKDD